MTDADTFADHLDALRAAASEGPFDWAGPIDDPAKWLRAAARRTRSHGDAQPNAWAVQSRDGEIVVAYCGTGPRAHFNTELIAYLLNNAGAIADALRSEQEKA